MLIEFSVENFRSFKERATLSMVAAKIKSRDPLIDENNTFKVSEKLTLLKTAPIYGANASGKSNLVRALNFMQMFILSSSRESQAGDPIPVDNFRLSVETENEPSFFETIFLVEGVQYRYGFEARKDQILTEWLFTVPSTKEANLFIRDENGIVPSVKFKEGKGLEEKTRSNALFLSVVAQFNGPISKKIVEWFRNVGIVSGLDDTAYRFFTVSNFASGNLRTEIIDFVKELDLGISDIYHINIDKNKVMLPAEMPEELKKLIMKDMQGDLTSIKTSHYKWSKEKLDAKITFDMDDESEGTQKLFFLAGPIMDVLTNGKILVIDEMEARLHPLLTRAVINLFNSNKTNPKNAQLIFTTHDTNLLSNKIFRRDQIWFIEKDHQGASHLYSLAELKVRNDASFESDYIEGRYGAIPFLGDLRQIFIDED